MFQSHGGARNLREVVLLFAAYSEHRVLNTGSRDQGVAVPPPAAGDPLELLVTWYVAQCDGEWEHGYGVSFSNDDAGWFLTINLEDSTTSSEPSALSRIDLADGEWFAFEVADQEVSAHSSPMGLPALLRRFAAFAEANPRPAA